MFDNLTCSTNVAEVFLQGGPLGGEHIEELGRLALPEISLPSRLPDELVRPSS